ncbi:MAG: hypothetical protein Q8R15_02180 [Candidatus Micrarchaeota archaeon]|nr:hypothetical protein [Candidatus Micrarchaeota archaeon]
MPELSAILLHRTLKKSTIVETHTISREGSSLIIRRKKEFRHAPFDEGNKAFILEEATRAIHEGGLESGNKRVTFDNSHPSSFSLKIKFRYRKRGEK